MSDRSSTESANGIVMATLAIPSDAIRVIAAPPDTISQKNVEAATGVPARVYLEAIRDPEFPLSVTRLGKLRIVNRAAFVEWLERGAFGRQTMEPFNGADIEMHQTDGRNGATNVLARIGLRERQTNRRPRRKR
jgi:hypothetical protein